MGIFYALIEGKPDLMVYYFMYIYMVTVTQDIPSYGWVCMIASYI